jgi:hypothetical protein
VANDALRREGTSGRAAPDHVQHPPPVPTVTSNRCTNIIGTPRHIRQGEQCLIACKIMVMKMQESMGTLICPVEYHHF